MSLSIKFPNSGINFKFSKFLQQSFFLEKSMEPFSFALLKKITYYDKLRRHFKISNCLPLEM